MTVGISKHLLLEAHRGLMADGVMEGLAPQGAHRHSLERLSKETGLSPAELLENPQLRGLTMSFVLHDEPRKQAAAHLDAATRFFGCSVDQLRSSLGALLTAASAEPVAESKLRARLGDPDLSTTDKAALLELARVDDPTLGLDPGQKAKLKETRAKFAVHFSNLVEHQRWDLLADWVDGFRTTLGEGQRLTPALTHDLGLLDAFVSMGRSLKPGAFVSDETSVFMGGANLRLATAWGIMSLEGPKPAMRS